MNEQDLIRQAMSAIGKRTSAAKSKAARANGAKGGRPRIKPKEATKKDNTKKG